MSTNNEFTIEDQREKAGLWFIENQSPSVKTMMELKAIHSSDSKKSPYQKIEVIETSFGRTLVTDGKSQSAECDEFIYHESLVHPSMLLRGILSNHSDKKVTPFVPKSVFIGGGGELATAREVLRHSSVERCVMVDLDIEVINVSEKYLPAWGQNARSDPRFELVIGDANAYLKDTSELFDIIIMDISDPIEAGPGIALYTQEFYRHALTKLTNRGVFVTQAGYVNFLHTHEGLHDSSFAPIKNTLESVFDCAIMYSIFIPSYQSKWGYVMAFNVDNSSESPPKEVHETVKNMSSEIIDNRIQDCIIGGANTLKHYDGCTHRHMFALVKALREKMEKDKRIMTIENPVFMY